MCDNKINSFSCKPYSLEGEKLSAGSDSHFSQFVSFYFGEVTSFNKLHTCSPDYFPQKSLISINIRYHMMRKDTFLIK